MKVILLISSYQELSENTILLILDKYYKSYGNINGWNLTTFWRTLLPNKVISRDTGYKFEVKDVFPTKLEPMLSQLQHCPMFI